MTQSIKRKVNVILQRYVETGKEYTEIIIFTKLLWIFLKLEFGEIHCVTEKKFVS